MLPGMLLNELDELIDSLSESEKTTLLTKKLKELPCDIKYQFLEELRTELVMELVGLNTIAQQIQTAQNVDIPLILESLVEHHRMKKNQGN